MTTLPPKLWLTILLFFSCFICNVVGVQILSKSKLEKCEKTSDSGDLNCTNKIVLNMAVPSGASGGEASIVAEIVEVEENSSKKMQTFRIPPVLFEPLCRLSQRPHNSHLIRSQDGELTEIIRIQLHLPSKVMARLRIQHSGGRPPSADPVADLFSMCENYDEQTVSKWKWKLERLSLISNCFQLDCERTLN